MLLLLLPLAAAQKGDELEYFEDGEDLNFDGVMAEKHRKKLYQVDYAVQSAKHLMGSQDKEVSQVASILGMFSTPPPTQTMAYFGKQEYSAFLTNFSLSPLAVRLWLLNRLRNA